MRCLACNCLMKNHEISRTYTNGTPLDLCDNCFEPVRKEIAVIEKYPEEDTELEAMDEEEDEGTL